VQAVLIAGFVLALAEQPRAPDSHIIAVSVAPEQTCPSARQVTDALAARLQGVVLPYGLPARPGMLRLGIAADGTGIRIDLADPDGAPLLHRMLAVARTPGECAALGDTIALIVERYWREVGYDAPPLQPPSPPPPPAPPPTAPPPPEPARAPPATVEKKVTPPVRGAEAGAPPLRFSAAAAVAGRAGDAGARDASALVAFAAEARVGVRLSGGVSNGTSAAIDLRSEATFRRYPLRLGAYLPIRTGIGQLEPGLGIDLDLVSVAANNGAPVRSPCSGGWCRSPGADLALGWSLASAHHVYVRALARAGVSASYDFVTTPKGDPIWRTPSTYLELALESGLWFP
jgi:hypothetical protein